MPIKDAPTNRIEEKKRENAISSRHLVRDSKGRIVFREPRSKQFFVLPASKVQAFNILENRYAIAILAGFLGYSITNNNIYAGVGIGVALLLILIGAYETTIRRGLERAEGFTQNEFDRYKKKKMEKTKAEGSMGHVISLLAGTASGILLIVNVLQTPNMEFGIKIMHYILSAVSFLVGLDGLRKLIGGLRAGK